MKYVLINPLIGNNDCPYCGRTISCITTSDSDYECVIFDTGEKAPYSINTVHRRTFGKPINKDRLFQFIEDSPIAKLARRL